MKWLKLLALTAATVAVSPLLLAWRYLDYCSYGWFSILAKQYLCEEP